MEIIWRHRRCELDIYYITLHILHYIKYSNLALDFDFGVHTVMTSDEMTFYILCKSFKFNCTNAQSLKTERKQIIEMFIQHVLLYPMTNIFYVYNRKRSF